jgi:hypothetical protein
MSFVPQWGDDARLRKLLKDDRSRRLTRIGQRNYLRVS